MMNIKLKDLFSIPSDLVYVNHAALGIKTAASIEIMQSLLEKLATGQEPHVEEIQEKLNQMRSNAGELFNASADDFAFVSNTTEGLTIALESIDLKAGENVIIQADSFPASRYILEYVFPRIEKRYVQVGEGEAVFEDIQKNIDSRTRAVVFDYVNFLTGYRIDLKKIGQICTEHKIYSIIDGIQGAGSSEVNLTAGNIDFFAAGGQKWLLGLQGTGLLYVKQAIIPKLRPFHVGWLSTRWENFESFNSIKPLFPTARRFQYSNVNYIGLLGFVENLKLFNSIGISEISEIILSATDFLIQALRDRGAEILAHPDRQHRSGIVSFRLPGLDSALVFQSYLQENIICSLREGFLRVAVHFFNTIEEMKKILFVLDRTLKSSF